MKPIKPALGCLAFIGVTLLQVVMMIVMGLIAYGGATAVIDALVPETSGDILEIGAFLIFLVGLFALSEWGLKRLRWNWLRLSQNPLLSNWPAGL